MHIGRPLWCVVLGAIACRSGADLCSVVTSDSSDGSHSDSLDSAHDSSGGDSRGLDSGPGNSRGGDFCGEWTGIPDSELIVHLFPTGVPASSPLGERASYANWNSRYSFRVIHRLATRGAGSAGAPSSACREGRHSTIVLGRSLSRVTHRWPPLRAAGRRST